jgi:hypothetical protein
LRANPIQEELEETGVTILRCSIVVFFILVIRDMRVAYKAMQIRKPARHLPAGPLSLSRHPEGGFWDTALSRDAAVVDELERKAVARRQEHDGRETPAIELAKNRAADSQNQPFARLQKKRHRLLMPGQKA